MQPRCFTRRQVIAAAGISTTAAYRHWNYARAWLYREFWGPEEA